MPKRTPAPITIACVTLALTAASSAAQLKLLLDFEQPTPVDTSGDGVTLTTVGGEHVPNAGPHGAAMRFDGIDDYIRVELNIGPMMDEMPQVTIGLWARPEVVDHRGQTLVSSDDGGYDRGIVIDPRDASATPPCSFNVPRWWAFNGGCPDGTTAPAETEWTFLAVTYDRFENSMRFYINDTEYPRFADNRASWGFFDIGRNPSFGEHFRGLIDNVFVFEGTLTTDQIEAIRQGGVPTILQTTPDTSERERFEHDGFMPDPTPAQTFLRAAVQTPQDPPMWHYTFETPGFDWDDPDFNPAADPDWNQGPAGFGLGSRWERDEENTPWTENAMWLRSTFVLTADDIPDPAETDGAPFALWGRWDQEITVFINGVRVALRYGDYGTSGIGIPVSYRYLPLLSAGQTGLWRVGENIINVYAYDGDGARFFDLAVVRNPFDNMMSTEWSTNEQTARFADALRRGAARAQFPAASMAVVRNGVIVAKASVGYADKHQAEPLPLDAYYRLASVSKPPAAAAMRQLIDEGFVDPVTGTAITLDTDLWPLYTARGLTTADGEPPHPWHAQMTVGQLIYHRSGMPYAPSPDTASEALGIPQHELTTWDIIRLIYSEDPLFEPVPLAAPTGTGQYSNEGYLILRDLIDRLTGDFLGYVNDEVLRAADRGVDPYIIAREPLHERHPDEPWYRTRHWPYERDYHLAGFHSLCSTAESAAMLAAHYAMPYGNPDTSLCEADSLIYHDVCGKGGSMPGTGTIVRQLHDDDGLTTYAIFGNHFDGIWVGEFLDEFEAIINDIGATGWFCTADLAEPFGTIDLADIVAFVTAFTATSPEADIDGNGVFDLADIVAFVTAFNAGCP